ncbi:MAG TPA: sulfide-dependent adenosine diphosphate thiazole synthase [Fervidobacterium sp.]|mgnify:FL=1|nr:sulfide-dependent adenosine diphosphate thiazole synthase [Fervidobacterium sp.]HPT53953.1 sulfide-dependent adenosine diphosphate thiazole synthase [Fervidobacterium sp.]HPZ17243.1 sulfide-dependent adenosine diphosphate thiazole synthase [Fervidobacterium sp.]HQE48315.1 sulfide-dependent adenosine diphosphate thiazole synthase [Fervidobacterium sp.]HUM42017.1 sulfide-dependent adenosine diphosphate thiazole synthase [Fervidobacterium sp.]
MDKKDTKISQIITKHFFKKFEDHLVVDVAISGCGPSALALATELAKNGRKVAIFEAKNEPGGGIWGGGMMFNEIVLEGELEWYLEEYKVSYKKDGEFLICDAVHFASAMLYNATKHGATIFNNMYVEDLLMYDNRVEGIVVNWAPTMKERLHVDPITVVAKYTIDGTGHPANLVRLLAKRGILNNSQSLREDAKSCKVVEFEFPMDAENGEKFVVENTGEIYPGLYVIGMAAVSANGGPRMGPIFGGMVMSGLKAAETIESELKKKVVRI